ncbi:UNVERIFIED_CONTAM: putative protein S-acyltransferase 16 [Sesamum latifolium]|uniref:S-acyltransferase n=1 Tax=Sesamum latifolium TaxID=2727402 RepID=A0AAW2XAK6_9LAMI
MPINYRLISQIALLTIYMQTSQTPRIIFLGEGRGKTVLKYIILKFLGISAGGRFEDHHCVWMNNCVGQANYKIFFVFVVYAVTACVYSLVLLLGSVTVDSQNDIDDSDRIIHVISGLLLVPLSLALGFFLGWHIYLIVQNKTTIEYHEGVRAMWLAEKGGQLYSHPYDIGVYENLTAILGPTILCWLCPTTGHVGSGLRFQTKYDRLIVSSAPD